MYVDDVDATHAEFVGRGAQDLTAVVDQTWGTREFGVTDPDQTSSDSASSGDRIRGARHR